jgi:hypothetical protein
MMQGALEYVVRVHDALKIGRGSAKSSSRRRAQAGIAALGRPNLLSIEMTQLHDRLPL